MQRTTVGAVLRSNQAFHELLGQRETLEHGIAFYSERFAALPDANQFREVVVDSIESARAARHAVRAFYARRGLTCRRWCPAEGVARAELATVLAGDAFVETAHDAMTLTRWAKIEVPAGVRVFPARAMRSAFRATFAPGDGGGDPEAVAEAHEERLDDAHMDMAVALIDGEPAGRCALVQTGDVGRVRDLHVLPAFEGRGAGRALLAHALALARRLALPVICAQVRRGDDALRRRLEAVGFEVDGHIVEYDLQPGARDP